MQNMTFSTNSQKTSVNGDFTQMKENNFLKPVLVVCGKIK